MEVVISTDVSNMIDEIDTAWKPVLTMHVDEMSSGSSFTAATRQSH